MIEWISNHGSTVIGAHKVRTKMQQFVTRRSIQLDVCCLTPPHATELDPAAPGASYREAIAYLRHFAATSWVGPDLMRYAQEVVLLNEDEWLKINGR